MLRFILIFVIGSVMSFSTLVACDQIRANEREGERLAEGQAAVDACVASQCETLNIDGMLLKDYTILNSLTHVKILMASRTDFDDLADISGMQQLTELHIGYTNITTLSGLSAFPDLRLLHVQGVPDLDVSPIAQLSNLRELALGGLGEDDDMSFIAELTQLEKLFLTWTSGEADLSGLQNHASIKRISLSGSLPEDQSALLTMPMLEYFSINNNTGGSSFRGTSPEVDRALKQRGILNMQTIEVC